MKHLYRPEEQQNQELAVGSAGLFFLDKDLKQTGTLITKYEKIHPSLGAPKIKLVPLKDVEILATLEGGFATVNVDMVYINPSPNPIECRYEFPLEGGAVLSQLFLR